MQRSIALLCSQVELHSADLRKGTLAYHGHLSRRRRVLVNAAPSSLFSLALKHCSSILGLQQALLKDALYRERDLSRKPTGIDSLIVKMIDLSFQCGLTISRTVGILPDLLRLLDGHDLILSAGVIGFFAHAGEGLLSAAP